MLKYLSIANYALIDRLEIDFNKGFSVITGETGAGKSIILGALSLILGNRADSGVLKVRDTKCIIEGVFENGVLDIENFFIDNDLDFDTETILRREILPSGKSRAFVNDTPVNLKVLNTIGSRLVNIHSQHQTLKLSDSVFQLEVMDGMADNEEYILEYRNKYSEYLDLNRKLIDLRNKLSDAIRDEDYLKFQLNELNGVELDSDRFNEMEERAKVLEHAEEIKSALRESDFLLNEDESSVSVYLTRVLRLIEGIEDFLPGGKELCNRLRSVSVEIEDIGIELQRVSPAEDLDIHELQNINEKINQINSLLAKHNILEVTDLIKLKEEFESRLSGLENNENEISDIENKRISLKEQLETIANNLHERRRSVAGKFEEMVLSVITKLGMKDAEFMVEIKKLDELNVNGQDKVQFLFSANKGTKPGDISKIASGGELSRLMLAIKSLITQQQMLPTVIFDEIDSGVSGDIAGKVGKILRKMASDHQIIAITHLPQIASKADIHFKVLKESDNMDTRTIIEKLDDNARVEEISTMLSSERVTDTARNVAREMINE